VGYERAFGKYANFVYYKENITNYIMNKSSLTHSTKFYKNKRAEKNSALLFFD
jgi:hypothetical protein